MGTVDTADRRPGGGLSVDEVKAEVKQFFARFRGRLPLKVDVAASQEELFGEQATIQNVGRITGAFYAARSAVALAAASFKSRRDVQAALRHEILGHFGSLTFAEEDKRALLAKLIEVRFTTGGLGSIWRKVERDYPEPIWEMSAAERDAFRDRQAEEVFAVAAESREPSTLGDAWVRIKSFAVQALRRVGLVEESITAVEVDAMIVSLARGIRNGTARQQIFPSKDDAQFARTEDRAFVSALTRAVERAEGAPRRADAPRWRQWLDGAQRRGEFKRAERDWIEVDAWLMEQTGPVSREAVLQFVRQHELQLGEIVLAERGRREQMREREAAYAAYRTGEITRPQWEDRLRTIEGNTRYSQYQLPGGDHYRELLITLPKATTGPVFNTTHWPGHENVLLHVRFNERSDADGARTLLIEELQSDWLQLGRRRGFGPQVGWRVSDENGQLLARQPTREAAEAIAEQYRTGQTPVQLANGEPGAAATVDPVVGDVMGVPDAPFQRTDEWALLGMKRVVQWAVERGFDQVAWTTGAHQLARYDLRHHVREVRIFRHADGERYDVSACDRAGQYHGLGTGVDGMALEARIGKELAERARAQPHGVLATYEGEDLTVGGQGMETFYDRILPSAVGRWLRAFGATVNGTQLDERSGAEHVHAFKITPALQSAVLGGLPLFRREIDSQVQTAEFRRWFGDSKVVDAQGHPLVVYKGMWPYDWTQEDAGSSGPLINSIDRKTPFPAFNGAEAGVKIAGFFGDRETANRFAEAMRGAAVYPVYLSFQNPLIIDANGANARDVQFGESGRPFRDAIRAGEHDGIVIVNTADEGTVYVALHPEQIKSAIGNNGQFDPLSADIRFRREVSASAVVEVDTRSAAFGDVGRQVELARVLREAAAALDGGAVLPMALVDLNGNAVGMVRLDASAAAGDVRIEIVGAEGGAKLAQYLRAVAELVEAELPTSVDLLEGPHVVARVQAVQEQRPELVVVGSYELA